MTNVHTFALLYTLAKLDVIDANINDDRRTNTLELYMDHDGMWLWLCEADKQELKELEFLYG